MDFDPILDFEDSMIDDDLKSCCDLDDFEQKLIRKISSSKISNK